MKHYWKVPFRAVYTTTFTDWVKSTIWCHFVIRVFPHSVDLRTDALVDLYLKRPETFYDQYKWALERVALERRSV